MASRMLVFGKRLGKAAYPRLARAEAHGVPSLASFARLTARVHVEGPRLHYGRASTCSRVPLRSRSVASPPLRATSFYLAAELALARWARVIPWGDVAHGVAKPSFGVSTRGVEAATNPRSTLSLP
jgi:hypothetical protein